MPLKPRIDEVALLEELMLSALDALALGRRGEALATLQTVTAHLQAPGKREPAPGPRPAFRPAEEATPAAGRVAAHERRAMTCPDCGARPGTLHELECPREEGPWWG
jgi:hypothetical protein